MTQDDLNEIIKDMENNYDEVGVNGESCLTTAHIKRILEDYVIKDNQKIKNQRLTAKLENGRICLIGMNEDNADEKVIAACKKLFDYEELDEPKEPIQLRGCHF
jgi:calcineurin-like phosphoesterase family protein